MIKIILRSLIIVTIINALPAPSPAQEPPACINSCCINCKAGLNCKVCYSLNQDTMACPCLADLSVWQRAALDDGVELFPKFSSSNKTFAKSSPLIRLERALSRN